MLPTKPARSLRKLLAGYHEPLPLSKQQSQKLLDGLKASFRIQLDREHGQAPADPAGPARGLGADAAARHSAASRHLKSILSNPLFTYQRPSALDTPPQSPQSPPRRDPMDVFDHAVARGMMTLKAATGCLVAKRRLLAGAQPASSEAAARVIRWLRSSGALTDLAFLDQPPFVRALVPFLLAERLEAVAWEWIARTVGDDAAAWPRELRVKRASCVLAELVRAKSQPWHGSLDAAMSTVLEAERRLDKSPLLPDLLMAPWRCVSWLSTVEAGGRTAPSEELFDAHVAAAGLLPGPLTVEKAHLHLHHPTHPDHLPALDFFRDRQGLRRLVQRLHPGDASWAKFGYMSVLPWIAFLGHDTVAHLAQSGRSHEAEDVTALLRSELADVFTRMPSPT